MKFPVFKSILFAAALLAMGSESLANQFDLRRPGRGGDRWDRGPGIDRGGYGRTQEFIIPMHDQVFYAGGRGGRDRGRRGDGGFGALQGSPEIKLKMLIRQHYGHVNLQDATLEQVKLIAKSARGYGSAELLMDGRRVDEANVQIFMGRRSRDLKDAFDFGGRRTFDRVVLAPYGRGSHARRWQIDLRGKIKVRRIKVQVRMNDWRPGPGPGPAPFDKFMWAACVRNNFM